MKYQILAADVSYWSGEPDKVIVDWTDLEVKPGESSELISFIDGKIHEALSIPVGAVRLKELPIDPSIPEQYMNDAFLQLWVGKYRPKGEAEAGKLLWQSMRHRQISLWRTGTRHPKRPLAEVQIAEPPPEEEAAEDTYQQIWELIKTQLTPLQQDILRRHDINDETYSEIAERLGMQEAAVRMQLSRARKKIREIYKQKRK